MARPQGVYIFASALRGDLHHYKLFATPLVVPRAPLRGPDHLDLASPLLIALHILAHPSLQLLQLVL